MERTPWRRRYLLLWQFVFLLVGTSWLWASQLNHLLTYRTSLISQYETSAEPYSWLFRTGDLLAGLLLLAVSLSLIKIKQKRAEGWLLAALSVGLICDPLLATTCRTVGDTCQEYFSISFLFHAIETVFTSSMFFILAIYDSWKRKKVLSIGFAIFQFTYGILFLSQLADQDHFNTLSQYVYQIALVVWLAWFCRDILAEKLFSVSDFEEKTVRALIAGWAFVNGILAIVLSLAHINLLGRIKGVYFSSDTAWLAQHGIVVGVIMIYLARHLARGEARARQIFLFLTGVEALKYALISPHAGLLAFYSLTFVILFLLRDDFNRGTLPLAWKIRLRDLYFMISGLLAAALVSLLALDRDSRASVITYRAVDHFSDYVFRDRPFPHRHINSVLLAHTLSVFIGASLIAILWILFLPYKTRGSKTRNYPMVKQFLDKYSNSTEDYFKLWPADKQYFWSQTGGFVAYKIVGTTAFGLPDPIARNRKRTLAEFIAWCRERRLRVCFLPVYPHSLKIYEACGLEPLQIGSSAVIDIRKFLDETAKDKWWRWRINKGQKSGYVYELARPPHASQFIKEMKKLSDDWLSGSGRAEHGFAMGYFKPAYLQQCVVHCLRDGQGKLVAFTNELPQFKSGRTLTVDLLRSDIETESMAFLIYKLIEAAASGGRYSHFDLGFVPFAKASGPLLAIAKAVSTDRFSAKGLEQFKNKFDPNWEPNYLAYDGDMADLGVIALNIESVMEPPAID